VIVKTVGLFTVYYCCFLSWEVQLHTSGTLRDTCANAPRMFAETPVRWTW